MSCTTHFFVHDALASAKYGAQHAVRFVPACCGYPAAFTLQLDDRRTAVRVIDSKVEARDIFLEKDELPKPGGLNPLLDLIEKNYAIEIFYFPGSSLDIQNVSRCARHHREIVSFVFDGYSHVLSRASLR